jgi:serine/threonine-protein kinase
MSALQSSRTPEVGDTVAGKYRVVRKIAEGGMGVVVEAVHLQLDERVAIKFLRAEALGNPAGGDIVARFLREARAALRIRSEHVVRVYDASILDNEVPYIVMEYLEGQDLEQALERRGPLPVAEAVDYVLQAAEALAEAHSLGIVHRDLKPANLFLLHSIAGVPMIKVLDFGISKDDALSGESLSITSAHAVLGSPVYMSPEQMRSTKDVDARADIWALGIILYELLTGRPPFCGETMPQMCSAILESVPLAPSRLRNQLPRPVEAAILKCLEKRADDRFPHVAALADALAPYGSDLGAEAATRIARGRLPGGRISGMAVRPPASTLAALARTNKSETTQAEERWPIVEAPSPRRRALVRAGSALALAGLVLGAFFVTAFLVARGGSHRAAVKAVAPPVSALAPSEAAPLPVADPPPEPAPLTVVAPPPSDEPTAAQVVPPPNKSAIPPRRSKPVAAKPAAAPSGAPAPPPSVPAAPSTAAPAPSTPVTWDERK